MSKMYEHRELSGVPEGLREFARAEFHGDGRAVLRMVHEWEEKTAAARKTVRKQGFLRELARTLEAAFASPGWG